MVRGEAWIIKHAADAAGLGEPLVLEEFGVSLNASRGVSTRQPATSRIRWLDAVLQSGGAGDQFWLLTSRADAGSFYPDHDGYRVMWNADVSNLAASLAKLLSAHAKAMADG
ncbi:MAG TPA: hypothetical protein VGS97_27365 [Actinocrinis sp.]|uniref:hypothetical protein n=1 Tax=Actinocrinis sp. TaxID=1920516 RepID=UPI002DDD1D12|nr:hypothetical protein [Actinocrinis sp.]HEV2347838.1 hypothetical protein [Actinocrinis sp.]